jgi:hypothetical protein
MIALNISDLPTGTSAVFSSNSIAGSGTTTLTIIASNSIAPGNYPLTINGVDGDLTISTNVTLSVTAPSIPNISSIQFKGNNLLLFGSNGTPLDTYYVLATTNLTLPISQWTVLSTNAFDSFGNFSFTNPAPVGFPQQYFLLRTQ